jgi:ADP-ribose pyrophosphatase
MEKIIIKPHGAVVWKGTHFCIYHENVVVQDNKIVSFEYVWRRDGTRTIAINGESHILLTYEYRTELAKKDWRLPGGKLSDENEDVELAAKREFEEETGYTAKSWKYLWSSNLDATVRFQRHFFLATELTAGKPSREVGEDIEVHWFPLRVAYEMALNGEVAEDISSLSIIKIYHQLNTDSR